MVTAPIIAAIVATLHGGAPAPVEPYPAQLYASWHPGGGKYAATDTVEFAITKADQAGNYVILEDPGFTVDQDDPDHIKVTATGATDLVIKFGTISGSHEIALKVISNPVSWSATNKNVSAGEDTIWTVDDLPAGWRVEWAIDDNTIASLDAANNPANAVKITGLKAGTAHITATAIGTYDGRDFFFELAAEELEVTL